MWTQLLERWEALRSFMDSGGQVLTAIFAVTLLMWILLLERYFFGFRAFPRRIKKALDAWNARSDKRSWNAEQIRRMAISQLRLDLTISLPMIQTLVAVCPLLGLMGTVTGMIEVFDVMAVAGSGNARAMASGVSMATIPTMAGLVAALSGIVFITRLERKAKQRVAALERDIAMERGETCAVA